MSNIINLNKCYDKIHSLAGNDIESFDSIELVEKYRQFWKPDKVNIILLAESHVFTSPQDKNLFISKIPDLPGYPNQYARFVYCLAYGESELINDNVKPLRDGTPQFWKIFYSCNNKITNNDDFLPILKKTPYKTRLYNKIQLLKNLKEKGIWLVDTSIVAVYKNGKKLRGISNTIKISWDNYTRNIIEENHPKYVICIGNGVSGIVASDLNKIMGNSFCIIKQPNAHLSSQEHISNYKRYYEICSKIVE